MGQNYPGHYPYISGSSSTTTTTTSTSTTTTTATATTATSSSSPSSSSPSFSFSLPSRRSALPQSPNYEYLRPPSLNTSLSFHSNLSCTYPRISHEPHRGSIHVNDTEVETLLDFLPDSLCTKTPVCALHALRVTQYDFSKAVEYLEDWAHVQTHSDLIKPPLGGVLQGMENGGNTCYIDALLFALFAQMDCMDPIFISPPPTFSPTYLYHIRPVQVQLALLVTRLRKGYKITALEMQHLEISIHYLWASTGRKEANAGSQEDVTELFFLLAEVFHVPFLPIVKHTWRWTNGHYLREASQAYRERCLQLAVPVTKAKVFSLEDLIQRYFLEEQEKEEGRPIFETRHEMEEEGEEEMDLMAEEEKEIVLKNKKNGIEKTSFWNYSSQEREKEASGWTGMTMKEEKKTKNKMKKKKKKNQTDPPLEQESNKARKCELHWMTPSNPSETTLVPILLKRYGMTSQGPSRLNTKVHIPFLIHVSSSQLVLRSVVCHQGPSMHSGHFIAFTLDPSRTSPYFLRFDGLQSQILSAPFSQFQETLDRDAYLLFYELQPSILSSNPRPLSTSSSPQHRCRVM